MRLGLGRKSLFWTFAGALGFLFGSYLLIPELFDGDARDDS